MSVEKVRFAKVDIVPFLEGSMVAALAGNELLLVILGILLRVVEELQTFVLQKESGMTHLLSYRVSSLQAVAVAAV